MLPPRRISFPGVFVVGFPLSLLKVLFPFFFLLKFWTLGPDIPGYSRCIKMRIKGLFGRLYKGKK